MYSCALCKEDFTRAFSLRRHMNRKHAPIANNSKSPSHVDHDYRQKPRMNTTEQSSTFAFKHPFTMMIAAPTGGGKTWFVKKLLENQSKWIQPPPERIVWLYGQWQPMYEEMRRTIPGIEFVKGIPSNIGEDRFLDPSVRNLLVIDDLMSDATKDTRICDLFTKGSHHRNLSVLCLLQNLYYRGKENRTMSLNSHYLVLFKNPRDQQQIAVLARQMYPGNLSQNFLEEYKRATERPYGHLVVDLKPDTTDDQRLRANILAEEQQDDEEVRAAFLPSIQPNEPPGERHAEYYTICDVLDELRQLRRDINKNTDDIESEADPEEVTIQRPLGPDHSSWQKEFDPATINMPSCLDCGAYYATLPDLHRHQATNCPASKASNSSEGGTAKPKKMSFEDEKPLWFETVQEQLNKEFIKDYNTRIREMVDKEGKSQETAQNKAFNEFVPKLRKSYRHALADYLILVRKILDTELYRKLMQTADSLMEDEGYKLDDAIKQAIKQRKVILDQIIMEKEVLDDDDDDDDDDDSATETDMESD